MKTAQRFWIITALVMASICGGVMRYALHAPLYLAGMVWLMAFVGILLTGGLCMAAARMDAIERGEPWN